MKCIVDNPVGVKSIDPRKNTDCFRSRESWSLGDILPISQQRKQSSQLTPAPTSASRDGEAAVAVAGVAEACASPNAVAAEGEGAVAPSNSDKGF